MTVYAVQQTLNENDEGQLVPKHNVSAARRFGDIKEILAPNAKPFMPELVIDNIYKALATFNNDDYILAIGNPILIGWSMTIAALMNDGKGRALQWNGKRREYVEIRYNLGNIQKIVCK